MSDVATIDDDRPADDDDHKPETGKAVAPIDNMRGALERLAPELKKALPQHVTVERLLRVTLTAVRNNPKLLQSDKQTFFAAVMTCAQLGLVPDGVLGQAYLVPFGGRNGVKTQLIVGYKGLLQLARNSGEIASLHAHEVRARDEFVFRYGTTEALEHVPAGGERGEITHFYAYATFVGGGTAFEVLTKDDVDKVRDGSEGYKAFKGGKISSNPWDSHYVEMGRKTAIRRLAKYLPMAVQKAAALDDAVDTGRPAHMDRYGEIVFEDEAVDADFAETADADRDTDGSKGAASKLDALAGTAKGGATAQVEADLAKADGAAAAPYSFTDADGEVTEGLTGGAVVEAVERALTDDTLTKAARLKVLTFNLTAMNAIARAGHADDFDESIIQRWADEVASLPKDKPATLPKDKPAAKPADADLLARAGE